MRMAATALGLCLLLTGLSVASNVRASITRPTDIPPQPLGTALQTLAKQRDFQVVYLVDLLKDVRTNGATGDLTAEQALAKLLTDTGLTYRYLDGQTVTILPLSTKASSITNTGEKTLLEAMDRYNANGAPATEQDVRLAQSETSPQSSPGEPPLQEVLVTAERKGVAERLQDVPVPISVISAKALNQSSYTKLEDYFDQIPGLMLAQGQTASVTSIRGITTGQNDSPTVGFTLDDVPLGASTNHGAVSQVPFINPADLAQVEVLRGPQGTLYGDNSMGGLIRYVTVDPSTDRISGDVRVGSDGVVGGIHLGYNTGAAINLPLTDTFAIRASAFTRLDPGFIDNVETGERGVNTTKAGGGRIVAKWTPSEDFSLKFSALYEKTDLYGPNSVDVPTSGYPNTLGLGDLQNYYYPQAGVYDQQWRNLSLTLNATVGSVKLTAITGYTFNEFSSEQDFTYTNFGPPSLATPILSLNQVHKFSQELRLSDTLGSHFEWLLGGFYTRENTFLYQVIDTVDPTSGVIVGEPGNIYWSTGPDRFQESAGFGALTWKATDQFDVQFGARESYLENPSLSAGSYSGGSLNVEPPGPSTFIPPSSSYWKANSFTYLVTPRFKLSPDVMIYARVADGFRPGSGTSNPAPNAQCVQQSEPCQINPDKITNYEVGFKADLLHRTLSVDASLYYIDWKDLQVSLVHTSGPYAGITYAANGSGAKSQGADLSLSWKPLEGLTISTWASWDQAVLTQSFAAATAGQPLPYSARFSGNLSVEEDVPISDKLHAFFGGTEIYIGDRLGEFTAPDAPRKDLPAYSQTDLNAGVKSDPWTFNLYVNNATDRRGLLFGGLGSPTAPFEFNYINPRTIGISVLRTF